MTKKELSILSEWQVVRHRMFHFDEELVAHRERIFGVEIDLLFRSRRRSYWMVVEVKSRFDDDLWGSSPISRRQSVRLLRTVACLQEYRAEPVDCRLAIVSHSERRYLRPQVRYFDLQSRLY